MKYEKKIEEYEKKIFCYENIDKNIGKKSNQSEKRLRDFLIEEM